MRVQKNISEMDDRELRAFRRKLKQVRARRRRARNLMLTMMVTIGMLMICTMSYRSIRTSANSGFKYYTSVTVAAGDSLWNLADKYIDYDYYKNKNSYIAEVQHINHLDDSCFIRAGQILILPYYSEEYK